VCFCRAAERYQEAAAHSDIVMATLTEELNTLREELDSKTAIGKRCMMFTLISFCYSTVYI